MKRMLSMILALLLVLSLAACAAKTDSNAEPEQSETNTTSNVSEAETTADTLTVEGGKYKLAAIMPMTGAYEWYGEQNVNGMKLAIKHWNEQYGGINGHPVELDVFDDRGDANESVNCANKVCDAKDEYIACNGSFMPDTTLSICPVFQKNGLILYSAMGSHKDVPTAGDYIFTMANVSKIENLDYSKVVFDEVGAKKAGLITAQSDFSSELELVMKEYAAKNGCELYVETYVADSTSDYAPILTKLFDKGIDTLVINDSYNAVATIYLQAQDMGLLQDGAKVVATGQCASEEFLNLLSGKGDGVVVCTTAPVYYPSVLKSMNASETILRFAEEYEKEFNTPANAFAGQSYDTVMAILGGVVELGTTDSDKLKDVMMDLCGMEEPACAEWLVYDKATRQLVKPAAMYEIKDGQFTPFKSGSVDPRADIDWCTGVVGY